MQRYQRVKRQVVDAVQEQESKEEERRRIDDG